jgi:phosphate uptake regulator
LEYQLLTGRRLLTDDGESLTNAYRMATIQGDANKQAELMNKLIEDEGDILSTNLIAREQAAKMLGMDEATLARSIQKQKLITKLGAEDLMRLNEGDMTKVAEGLRERGVDEKDISDLLKASDTRTTQERMADTLDQILSRGIFAMSGGKRPDADL